MFQHFNTAARLGNRSHQDQPTSGVDPDPTPKSLGTRAQILEQLLFQTQIIPSESIKFGSMTNQSCNFKSSVSCKSQGPNSPSFSLTRNLSTLDCLN